MTQLSQNMYKSRDLLKIKFVNKFIGLLSGLKEAGKVQSRRPGRLTLTDNRNASRHNYIHRRLPFDFRDVWSM